MGRASTIVVRAAGHAFCNSETGTRIAREVGFTTNNRMELTAVIAGLRPLTRPCVITVLNYSDYVRPGITEFLPRWRSVGWRNSAGKPVLNRECGKNSTRWPANITSPRFTCAGIPDIRSKRVRQAG